MYLIPLQSPIDNGDKSQVLFCVLVKSKIQDIPSTEVYDPAWPHETSVVRESIEHVKLTLTVCSGSRYVWDISEAPRCSRKLFKTVKPEITQVSLSMPASPASIMAAKSCVVSSGSQLCGQVSQLCGHLVVSILWFLLVNVLQKQD